MVAAIVTSEICALANSPVDYSNMIALMKAKTVSRKGGRANDGKAGKSTDFRGHPPNTGTVLRICASMSKWRQFRASTSHERAA
jgi:hypothetical protein